MNYVSIDLVSLRSEAFVRAEPVCRSTWLCLLAYCADQENGGKIHASKDWTDRNWIQLVNITKREVFMDCDLWEWVDDDLLVKFYPADIEERIKAKRISNKKAALTRWNASRNASRNASCIPDAMQPGMRNSNSKVKYCNVPSDARDARTPAHDITGDSQPDSQADPSGFQTDSGPLNFEKKAALPRTAKEAREWAGLCGVPEDFAEQEFHNLNRADWHDSRGRRINNFRSHLQWAFNYARSRQAETRNGSGLSPGARMMARRQALQNLEALIASHPANEKNGAGTEEVSQTQIQELAQLCKQADAIKVELAQLTD